MGDVGEKLSTLSDGGDILVLMPKIQQSMRLSQRTLDTLQRLADRLDLPRPRVVEMAVRHFDVDIRLGNPIHFDGGDDDEPKAHKRPNRAG